MQSTKPRYCVSDNPRLLAMALDTSAWRQMVRMPRYIRRTLRPIAANSASTHSRRAHALSAPALAFRRVSSDLGKFDAIFPRARDCDFDRLGRRNSSKARGRWQKPPRCRQDSRQADGRPRNFARPRSTHSRALQAGEDRAQAQRQLLPLDAIRLAALLAVSARPLVKLLHCLEIGEAAHRDAGRFCSTILSPSPGDRLA